MSENPLKQLESYNQSIWIDFIRRGTITSGDLKRWIDEDGISGVTSNPSIFEKAIAGSHDYDDDIQSMAKQNKSVEEIYQSLTVTDIQKAADLFKQTYHATNGKDGFVSLEVSPLLAHDTEATIREARHLWSVVNRPNVMIKVPGTREGLPAIRQLISEGINVNITLLFGLPRYRDVVEAYLSGLEERVRNNQSIERVASVASFFLSRIDVLIDPSLEVLINAGGEKGQLAEQVLGETAIASAKEAYIIYQELFQSSRFKTLADQGARTQRLLWASTSTKNPKYSDVKYVEALVGPNTINTLPIETLNAYRDHGEPAPRLTEGLEAARRTFAALPKLGINLDAATQQLEDEAVEKFIQPYQLLMNTLREKREAALQKTGDSQVTDAESYQDKIRTRLSTLEKERFSDRLWRKDASLWSSDTIEQESIRNALGWLHVAEKMEENLNLLTSFVDKVNVDGFSHVVHMGMGGSSLAPLVFQKSFQKDGKGLPLTILDTTDPTTIHSIERELPLAHTLFIVASKSGTTAEPIAFEEYFYAKVKALKGNLAGENFVAITDPGTPAVKVAHDRNYRQVFLNFADIGGRYSALSYFGLVPAALMGIDAKSLLDRALRKVHACASSVPVKDNPGMVLGAALGEFARQGMDKVTFVMPESISTLGMWLEQLLAESTGKKGTGLIPIAGERLGTPSVYGNDRVFVCMEIKGEADPDVEEKITTLKKAGHPMVTIQMDSPLDLGQEFFRWEIATAVAGAVLEINPFDQPNVQESKDNTNRLLDLVRKEGKLPEQPVTLIQGPLSFFGQENASNSEGMLKWFFSQEHPGDYVAILAYLHETPETDQALQRMRLRLRDRLHLATTSGYGPRYLHSTGQLHKGGPNTGLYLQITADEEVEVPIPGQPYTFNLFQRAQALGDLESLHRHNRRAMRIHINGDLRQGLAALARAVEAV